MIPSVASTPKVLAPRTEPQTTLEALLAQQKNLHLAVKLDATAQDEIKGRLFFTQFFNYLVPYFCKTFPGTTVEVGNGALFLLGRPFLERAYRSKVKDIEFQDSHWSFCTNQPACFEIMIRLGCSMGSKFTAEEIAGFQQLVSDFFTVHLMDAPPKHFAHALHAREQIEIRPDIFTIFPCVVEIAKPGSPRLKVILLQGTEPTHLYNLDQCRLNLSHDGEELFFSLDDFSLQDLFDNLTHSLIPLKTKCNSSWYLGRFWAHLTQRGAVKDASFILAHLEANPSEAFGIGLDYIPAGNEALLAYYFNAGSIKPAVESETPLGRLILKYDLAVLKPALTVIGSLLADLGLCEREYGMLNIPWNAGLLLRLVVPAQLPAHVNLDCLVDVMEALVPQTMPHLPYRADIPYFDSILRTLPHPAKVRFFCLIHAAGWNRIDPRDLLDLYFLVAASKTHEELTQNFEMLAPFYQKVPFFSEILKVIQESKEPPIAKVAEVFLLAGFPQLWLDESVQKTDEFLLHAASKMQEQALHLALNYVMRHPQSLPVYCAFSERLLQTAPRLDQIFGAQLIQKIGEAIVRNRSDWEQFKTYPKTEEALELCEIPGLEDILLRAGSKIAWSRSKKARNPDFLLAQASTLSDKAIPYAVEHVLALKDQKKAFVRLCAAYLLRTDNPELVSALELFMKENCALCLQVGSLQAFALRQANHHMEARTPLDEWAHVRLVSFERSDIVRIGNYLIQENGSVEEVLSLNPTPEEFPGLWDFLAMDRASPLTRETRLTCLRILVQTGAPSPTILNVADPLDLQSNECIDLHDALLAAGVRAVWAHSKKSRSVDYLISKASTFTEPALSFALERVLSFATQPQLFERLYAAFAGRDLLSHIASFLYAIQDKNTKQFAALLERLCQDPTYASSVLEMLESAAEKGHTICFKTTIGSSRNLDDARLVRAYVKALEKDPLVANFMPPIKCIRHHLKTDETWEQFGEVILLCSPSHDDLLWIGDHLKTHPGHPLRQKFVGFVTKKLQPNQLSGSWTRCVLGLIIASENQSTLLWDLLLSMQLPPQVREFLVHCRGQKPSLRNPLFTSYLASGTVPSYKSATDMGKEEAEKLISAKDLARAFNLIKSGKISDLRLWKKFIQAHKETTDQEIRGLAWDLWCELHPIEAFQPEDGEYWVLAVTVLHAAPTPTPRLCKFLDTDALSLLKRIRGNPCKQMAVFVIARHLSRYLQSPRESIQKIYEVVTCSELVERVGSPGLLIDNETHVRLHFLFAQEIDPTLNAYGEKWIQACLQTIIKSGQYKSDSSRCFFKNYCGAPFLPTSAELKPILFEWILKAWMHHSPSLTWTEACLTVQTLAKFEMGLTQKPTYAKDLFLLWEHLIAKGEKKEGEQIIIESIPISATPFVMTSQVVLDAMMQLLETEAQKRECLSSFMGKIRIIKKFTSEETVQRLQLRFSTAFFQTAQGTDLASVELAKRALSNFCISERFLTEHPTIESQHVVAAFASALPRLLHYSDNDVRGLIHASLQMLLRQNWVRAQEPVQEYGWFYVLEVLCRMSNDVHCTTANLEFIHQVFRYCTCLNLFNSVTKNLSKDDLFLDKCARVLGARFITAPSILFTSMEQWKIHAELLPQTGLLVLCNEFISQKEPPFGSNFPMAMLIKYCHTQKREVFDYLQKVAMHVTTPTWDHQETSMRMDFFSAWIHALGSLLDRGYPVNPALHERLSMFAHNYTTLSLATITDLASLENAIQSLRKMMINQSVARMIVGTMVMPKVFPTNLEHQFKVFKLTLEEEASKLK